MVIERQELPTPISFVFLNRRDLRTSPLYSTQCQSMPEWPSLIVISQHTMVNWRRTWPACIAFVLNITVSWCLIWDAPIVCGLYTLVSWRHKWLPSSSRTYTHQFADIWHCPRALPIALKYRFTNVRRVLDVSPMSCTLWSANVGHAYPHRILLALVRRTTLHVAILIKVESTTCRFPCCTNIKRLWNALP